MEMDPEAEIDIEVEIESDSSAFLFKSLKRLYIFAQIFGCAPYSYTTEHRVHVTPMNAASFIFFTTFYLTVAYLNTSLELTIDAKGYQSVLFYIGIHIFPSFVLVLFWVFVCLLFMAKNKIAHLMEEIIALDSEVSEFNMLN